MAAPIRVSGDVVVPASALSFRAARSSGPGGQNVNKVASKVELRVQLDGIQGLSPEALRRLERLSANRLDAGGRLLVVSQRTRDQHLNRADVEEKVRALVERALWTPRVRRPTRATRASRETRLAEKKRSSRKKRARSGPRDED